MGHVLKGLIQKHRTSLRKLSTELGIPVTTLLNYCQGTMPQKAEYILKLCQRFNITADELLFDIARRPNEIRDGDLLHGKFKVIQIYKDGQE